MPTFGIIAEGVTDQLVIEHVLSGFFGAQEVDVTRVQPPERRNDDPVPYGGWTLVFEALRQGEHKQALLLNDYLIIQIDTDRCNDYGVPHQDGARVLDVDEIVRLLAVHDKNPSLALFVRRLQAIPTPEPGA